MNMSDIVRFSEEDKGILTHLAGITSNGDKPIQVNRLTAEQHALVVTIMRMPPHIKDDHGIAFTGDASLNYGLSSEVGISFHDYNAHIGILTSNFESDLSETSQS